MSLLGAILKQPDPETVVRDHGPSVYRHLKRIFGPNADVDDAYQMVFVEVLRSLSSFRGRAKLSTWIRRITWNVAYQEMRMGYRHDKVSSLDEPDAPLPTAPEPVAVLESREGLRHFYAALDKLEPKQRIVVALYDVEGLTLKEVSESVGRPLPTVASQLAAGRAALVAWMNERQGVLAEPESSDATDPKASVRRDGRDEL